MKYALSIFLLCTIVPVAFSQPSKPPLPKAGELPPSPFFTTGQQIAPFTVKDVQTGEVFKSKSLTGKVVVLNFWFIDCPPCRDEMPRLNELAAAYKNNRNVVFIAMATDKADDLKKLLKETSFSYHVVSDPATIRRLGISGFPTNVIIGKDGSVLQHTIGGLPRQGIDLLKKAIDGALAANP